MDGDNGSAIGFSGHGDGIAGHAHRGHAGGIGFRRNSSVTRPDGGDSPALGSGVQRQGLWVEG